MNKYMFIKEVDQDNEHDKVKITFEFEAEASTELREQFDDFLIACGFNVGSDE